MASIKKLKSGWQYRVSYKRDNGEFATKSGNRFRTKKDAEAAAYEIELLLKKGAHLDAGKISFEKYFLNWFELYKKDSVSEKTGTHYYQTHHHIKKYFGKTAIIDITEDSYQSFLREFGQTHAKETAAKLNTHCRSCFKRAIKQDIIQHNPADDIVVTGENAPKAESSKYLSEDSLMKLIDSLLDHIKPLDASRHLLLFTISSGTRFSEAQGLTWDCVNFSNNTVRINKTWDSSKNNFGPTKNESSDRLIVIDEMTMDILKKYHENQKEKQIKNKNLVFLSYLSDLPTNNSVNKSLRRALKRADIHPVITHHGLRHTHVSVLLHNGVNIKYISRRIGHATVSTTYDKYAHIIDEMEQTENRHTSEIIRSLYYNAK